MSKVQMGEKNVKPDSEVRGTKDEKRMKTGAGCKCENGSKRYEWCKGLDCVCTFAQTGNLEKLSLPNIFIPV